VGENGSGKSTLLEAIAISWGFNAEGGSKNFNFSTQSTHSDLYKCLRLSKGTSQAKDGYFLRAESFYNVASEVKKLGVGDSYGDKALHDQSHGESFMSLVLNRFSGNGLYILDEPEAALSPSRQLALISRIHDLVSQNSQFIIATHSPILMAYPDSCIFVLEESGIKNIDYTETEHYQVTKEFINNYPKMLKILMAD
jgi:predicted ATPase